MPVVIWWLRRDLRLNDNPALAAALNSGAAVLPVFMLDPHLLAQPAENRQRFLFAGLRQLAADLQARGSHLLVRRGTPQEILPRLVAESGATAIYAEENYSPFSARRDRVVQAAVPLRLVTGLTVHHPAAVLKADGSPYTVFTPFSKAWKNLPLPLPPGEAPARLPAPPDLPGDPLPAADPLPEFPAGEAEAMRRLRTFLQRAVFTYSEQRNRLDLEGTSRLSPYLRFGMLSASRAAALTRQAADDARNPLARKGAETFLNELIWREFYNAILYHFPRVLRESFNPSLRHIAWRDAPQDLSAWQRGATGVPVVDACMRQLQQTGWMHNRGRMIVASYLVKDLLIDWRAGESWFLRHLVDGDPAANNGGWQWTAGTGCDAAPYFRIFNPVLQSKKFDPRGVFIRRYLPELARIPDEYIHEPWLMPLDIQRASGFTPGRDYPLPLVEHHQARERTLRAYQKSKMQPPE
ncbi:MAG: deoxyribodipyrimidine photo-lyase [Chloroflexota bacterium]|jgi:deoxyribodipyrimidine photo-lyase